MIGGPVPNAHVQFYGMYFQDDWKVSPKLTLNLGIRNEYETPIYDPEHEFSQGLNLTAPVPQMQANPPQMPAAATSIVGNNFYQLDRPVGLHQRQPSGHVQCRRNWRCSRASAPLTASTIRRLSVSVMPDT